MHDKHYRNWKCTQMHWHMAYITRLMNKHEWKQLMINVKYLMCKKHKTQLMLFCVIWIILQNTKIIFATTSFLQWQSNWFLLYQHRYQLTTSGCYSVCCDQINHEFPRTVLSNYKMKVLKLNLKSVYKVNRVTSIITHILDLHNENLSLMTQDVSKKFAK